MVNQLDRGAARLASRLVSYAGETVTYARGVNSASITATPAPPDTEVDADGQVYTGNRRQDFLIAATEWADVQAVIGAGEMPATDDVVTFNSTDYRLTPHVPNDDVWRWEDANHNILRIRASER